MSDRSGPERQIFAPCTACDTLWPIQDLTPKTGICPNCIERDRIRADVPRSRLEATRVLRELVTQQRGKKIDSPHISEMCAEMIANDLKSAKRYSLLKAHGLNLPLSVES